VEGGRWKVEDEQALHLAHDACLTRPLVPDWTRRRIRVLAVLPRKHDSIPNSFPAKNTANPRTINSCCEDEGGKN